MNNNAAQAVTRLTIAYQALEDAIRECDALRRPPLPFVPSCALGERTCMECESFDLDYLIRQMEAMATLATNRGRQVRWISEQIKAERVMEGLRE